MKQLAPFVLLGIAALAHAQEADKGMYFGASLGELRYDETSGGSQIGVSDNTYLYHLLGGYNFNQHFGLEVGLGGTGDLEESFMDSDPFLGPITLEVKGTYKIYSLMAMGYLPFDRLSLFAGAGYYSASLAGDVNITGFGTIGSLGGHERGATALLGIQHDLGLDLRSISIRGQYEWYDFESGIDVAAISVGVLFRL